MGRNVFNKAVEKGNRAVGDAYHEGAEDGKKSVAFHKRDGELRSFDASDDEE